MKPLLDLPNFLPYRLSILSNRVSGGIARLYEERFGLSVPEWRVMAVVGAEPGLSAREVAARTAMDKVAVSRAVSRLLENGHLARSIAEEDRRRSVLSLSPAGRRLYGQIAPLARAYEDRLLSHMSAGDVHRLDQTLTKLSEAQAELERGEEFAGAN